MTGLGVHAPIPLTGNLRKPDIKPDRGSIARGGAALLLGTLALPAAIIPLFESGPEKDSDRRVLISLVGKRSGAISEVPGRP